MSISNKVHELDATTLQPFFDAHHVVLLAVLMLPQSERSQELVPVLQSIADASAIAVGQINVNGNGNWDAVSSFGITTYPHIMLSGGWGGYKVYRGALVETSIVSYMNRFLKFPTITRLEPGTLRSFQSSHDVVVVGYIGPEDSTAATHFENLAKAMHPEYVFGVTDNIDFARADSVDVPAVVVYNNATQERCKVPITHDLTQMQTCIRKAAQPLVVELYPEIHDDLLDLDTPFAYIFTTPNSEALTVELPSLARKYHGKLQFSSASASRVPSIVADMHLASAPLPAFGIREPLSNRKYPMPTPASGTTFLAAVEEFVKAYIANTLNPTLKSEPTPPPSPSGLIKVVGTTYNTIINDPTRDVLLTICTAHCAPCHRLYPVLEELAASYSAEEAGKTTIATVLYDKNDTPLRRVRAFPTILLFPVGGKGAPVRFWGERTVRGVRGFVEGNRGVS
ncbi:thioredoxin-like domain-containing protein [Phaeosphaeria sp. MPI-PUGE-AT-0046c]|nr:thioredoxin-like domain-containing protein [Phaeosphaeria sp. MPI-PUGE-AT-0046c]